MNKSPFSFRIRDMDQPFEDCDYCGERFVGTEFIRKYLLDVEHDGELFRLCRDHLDKAPDVAQGEV